jgi:crotonobetainyl-CoA:carnitine CoA-transferase CaiB-like acyl-CoA transferase
VYESVTGYGRSGPDAGRAGYDVGAFWARSGLASLAVPPDAPQPHFRGGVGDHVTAITTVAGVLGALFERERTGRGRIVETSLLRTGIWALGWDLGLTMRFGKVLAAQPRSEQGNPMVNVYRAADGRWFWLLGVEGDRLWPGLLRAIDREAWADDERFSSMRARRYNAAALIELLDTLFATRPRDEWTALFDAHDVWWAPVNTAEDVLEDPQAIAAGAFVDVPGGVGTPEHRAVASPVSFPSGDDDAARPRGPVPALGEHTAEILTELGF